MADEIDRLKEDIRQLESELESFENSECDYCTKTILKNLIKTLLERGASKIELLEKEKVCTLNPRGEKDCFKNLPQNVLLVLQKTKSHYTKLSL